MKRAMACGVLFCLIGCARESPLPRYPAMSLADAKPILRDKTPTELTLQGQLNLSEPGRSVRLDTAMVLRQPSELRLRAWKFGQAVFDLTVRPDGVYAYSGQKNIEPDQLRQVAGSITPWLGLLAPIPADATVFDESKSEWAVKRTIDGVAVHTWIDRETLVPSRHEIFEKDQRRATITLSNYRLFKDGSGNKTIPWPGTIVVSEGKRRIELNTASLKPQVAPRAFEPPRRAERLTP